jgi:S1-C subfamily serine protease
MKRKLMITISIAAVFMLAGCSLLEFAANYLPESSDLEKTFKPTEEAQVQPVLNETLSVLNAQVIAVVQQTFQSIYNNVNPSVVNLQVVEDYGWTTVSGEGSGFVWDENGHIVTNTHVVADAINIIVTFSDGTTATAEIIGTDPQSDLAVIKVKPEGLTLQPVTIGDSQHVAVGDLVIAIGNPYGLSGTMTQGIVSALSRSLTVDESSMFSRTNYTIPDIIQTDAAINPGNSGGVLVNVTGEVIGVTAAIQSSTDSNAGIGFVIPAHIVARVIPALIKDGEYEHPSLGLSGITLTLSLAQQMGIDEATRGVLVTEIIRNGAAEKAGLQGSYQQMVAPGKVSITYGDVITAADGLAVNSYEDLVSYVFNQTRVGQVVSLTILRDGVEKTVNLTLQEE